MPSDVELLTSLSDEELDALANSTLAPASQDRMDELLALILGVVDSSVPHSKQLKWSVSPHGERNERSFPSWNRVD